MKSLKFYMGSSESTLSNTGQPLLVAAALGKSLETLLGPTGAMKMVHKGLSGRESDVVVSSSPTALLRAMEVFHPCGTLILQTLEGMEEAYGSGPTSLIALCGALSTACYNIQEQGVPVNSILNGLRVAEDLCIDVLRDLSFPTKDALLRGLQEVSAFKTFHDLSCRHDGLIKGNHREQQQSTSQSGKNYRISLLAGLAAGLQHNIQPEGSVAQDLSLPAALAADTLSALGFENVFGDDTMGVDAATELARVRTRLLVGPASTSSFVVPRAAIVNIAPGERAALEEAFANGCTSCTKLPEGRNSTISLSRAIATICIRGVVIVTGDLSATAGASNAAINQTPTTGILRNADMLLNRSAVDISVNNRWAERISSTLQHFGVDVLLVTGEVCAKLRQLLALKGVLVLSRCLQEEVRATGSASGATPVQTIDVLTSGDIGRGRGFQREERQRGSTRDQCGGLVASLLDVGVASEERSIFVPELRARRGPGLGFSDTLFLLHEQRLDDIDIPNTGSGTDSTNAKAWTKGEETHQHADIVVMCCGTTLSVCEELRLKFWRVVRRISGALTEGVVLPGAGASEVVCAANLELEAQRLETENAGRLGHPTSMTQLYTPLILRAMAEALDEVILSCMVNAGRASPDASQRLSAAKKAAVKHLLRRQGQTVTTSSRLPNGSDSTGFNPCPMWGLVPELAVISVAAIDGGESSVEGALVGFRDDWDGNSKVLETLQGSLDHLPLEGYCQQRRSLVLDNYGSKIGCFERAVGLVSLLTGTDSTLLAPV